MTDRDLQLLFWEAMTTLVRVLAFTYCALMFLASLYLTVRFMREGEHWSALGAALFLGVCLIAIWGILR
jgi:hypothetical protein